MKTKENRHNSISASKVVRADLITCSLKKNILNESVAATAVMFKLNQII